MVGQLPVSLRRLEVVCHMPAYKVKETSSYYTTILFKVVFLGDFCFFFNFSVLIILYFYLWTC